MIDLFFLIVLFILTAIIGYELITKIPPLLHTPLMSGTNAISGIIIVGALLSLPNDSLTLAHVFGFVALTLATINVVGGYTVTTRMLRMFKKK